VDDIAIARAVHVLAVVIWIGGVSMATTVVLPAVRRGDLGTDRLKTFQEIERGFGIDGHCRSAVSWSGIDCQWRPQADSSASALYQQQSG
jgi:hypothetical protein